MSLVDANLGDAVGKEYVAKYFPPDSKAKMDDLVANLKTAMAARIGGLSWMSAQTKEQALVKLSKMSVMVGYPVKWRDYSTLALDAGRSLRQRRAQHRVRSRPISLPRSASRSTGRNGR